MQEYCRVVGLVTEALDSHISALSDLILVCAEKTNACSDSSFVPLPGYET